MSKVKTLGARHEPPSQLDTPTDLSIDAVRDISRALNGLLADAFALYVKTKNFHWHVSGPHFRDYHLLLDEQAEQIFAHHRRDCRTCAQDRRHHAALHRRYREASNDQGQ